MFSSPFHQTLVALVLFVVSAGMAYADDYLTRVKPILEMNCIGCHAASNPSSGFAINTLDGILAGGLRGPAVVPGKPEESLLYQLSAGHADPKMPPDPLLPLEDDELEAIYVWIANMDAERDEAPQPSPIQSEQPDTPAAPSAPAAPPSELPSEPEASEGASELLTQTLQIFEANCIGCHGGSTPSAGLNLASFAALRASNDRRPVILPGNPEESRLYQAIAGLDDNLIMPPKPMLPLLDDEIEVIRQWIAQGADFTDSPRAETPTQTPLQPTATASVAHPHAARQIGSLAFHPTEPLLAVGRLHLVEIYRIDANYQLALVAELEGHAHLIRALAFNPDGSLLAAGGGFPSVEGEIILWETESWLRKQVMRGHSDNVYSIDFSPDGARLISGSYDALLKLWDVETGEDRLTLKDHVDAVYQARFSPDGSRIASAAADRTLKLWDAETGQRLFTLSDSLGALYALAFHPSGERVSASGADRMIRSWDLFGNGGRQRIAKFAHNGPILGLAYNKDGSRLFSTAEDQLVKAWSPNEAGDDYSESLVWGPQSDWVFAISLSADGNLIAVGTFDGALRIYDAHSEDLIASLDGIPTIALAETASSEEALELEAQPAASESEGDEESTTRGRSDDDDPFRVQVVMGNGTHLSSLSSIEPRVFMRGDTVTLTVKGQNLEDAEIVVDGADYSARIIDVERHPIPEFTRADFTTAAEIVDTGQPFTLTVEMDIPADAPAGLRFLRARTPLALSNAISFAVEDRTAIQEQGDNNRIEQGLLFSPPAILAGKIDEVGEVDYYQFNAKAGQELVFDVMARAIGSNLTSRLEVLTLEGVLLASSDDFGPRNEARVAFRFPESGTFALRIQDTELRRGGAYRIHVSERPWITGIFPLGAQRGSETTFYIDGFNLDGQREVTVHVPEDADSSWSPFSFTKGDPIDSVRIALSDWPETLERENNDTVERAMEVSVPTVINGKIVTRADGSADVDFYRFRARKGEPLVFAVEAQQYGSPLDSIIELFDENGAAVEVAVVRSVAETHITLADRDSRTRGIRLDSWSDLRINDWMMIGSEILRVIKLPDYPDEDVIFAGNTRFGWRYGYFGTTPSQHAVHTPAYKVEIHPPGSTFPPNGLPTYTLYARNDDGGAPIYRRDSYYRFDPPADGVYHVSITDTLQKSGPNFAYRLQIREPRPDFRVHITNDRPNIHRGGRFPLGVRVDRIDGFTDPIAVRLEGLPEGYTAEPGLILEGEEECVITIHASEAAQSTSGDERFMLIAAAEIDGETVTREARIAQLTAVAPADVAIVQEPAEVVIEPGRRAPVHFRIERRNNFKGRVPISVDNLPHGVYVMDTGLNGILINEHETERTIFLYAEPWIEPMDRAIHAVANVETRSPIRHFNASNSSTLKIIPGTGATARLGTTYRASDLQP